ncbi:metallophosphoesterase family protein [Desulfurobacterium sp.]
MKIDVISDIHIEESNEIDIKPEGRILIVAGDVSQDADVVVEFLNKTAQKYEAVIYTFGNIELWDRKDPYKKLLRIKENLNRNIFVLDFLKGIKIKTVTVTGSIYISPENLTNHDRENIVDANTFVKKLSRYSRTTLHRQIKELNPQIIVTHYPPVSVSTLKKITNCQEINFKRIWIFGHYHQFKSFKGTHPIIKDILYVSNASNKVMTIEI